MRANYGAPKSPALRIIGVPFLSGFKVFDLPMPHEVVIPTSVNFDTNWTFVNYTTEDYYGISLELNDFQGTSCQLTVTVYAYTKLSKVEMYFITYETSLTNTYKTRTVTGSAAVGCYYDIGGCVYPLKVKVTSNTSFTTAQTYLTPFYNTMYFFGLNHFIIYQEYDDLDFLAPFVNPTVKMKFAVTTSGGSDAYTTNLAYTGNLWQLFSFKFGYMIDVSSDCPSTGEIYHVNSYQCDTVCPIGFYPNNTDYYCYSCHIRCYQCTGPLVNQCTNCHNTLQHRILNGTLCVCQLLYYYDDIVSDICPGCSHTCLTCNFSSTSSCLSCNLTDNRYDDGNFSCPCNPGWYDNGGRTCAKCDVTCTTCFGGAWNNCITCP